MDKERQLLRDAANQEARRETLRETLLLLTHPPGSDSAVTNRPELWTPDAWASRFIELAEFLKSEGIDTIPLAPEKRENLPLPHRCALHAWELAFRSERDALTSQMETLKKDERGNTQFQFALLVDLREWFSGHADWGDCFYDPRPRPTMDSIEAISAETRRIREELQRQIQKRPNAKRWARISESELLLGSRRKGVEAILPELRPLWMAMHAIGGSQIPDFPIDTAETLQGEPFRTLRILETVEKWCKDSQATPDSVTAVKANPANTGTSSQIQVDDDEFRKLNETPLEDPAALLKWSEAAATFIRQDLKKDSTITPSSSNHFPAHALNVKLWNAASVHCPLVPISTVLEHNFPYNPVGAVLRDLAQVRDWCQTNTESSQTALVITNDASPVVDGSLNAQIGQSASAIIHDLKNLDSSGGQVVRAVRTDSTARLILRGRDECPIVLGKEKAPLTDRQYNVIKTLLDAGKRGLTKDKLDEKSGHPDARKVLKALQKQDEDWAAVIQMPGTAGKGGYRIK